MKKIIMGIAAVAMAASMFAADFSANTRIDGSVFNLQTSTHNYYDGNNNPTETVLDNPTIKGPSFNGNNRDQKDNDGLIVSMNGEKAGANFQFFFKAGPDVSEAVNARKVSVWFKPIDKIKITLGTVADGWYKERINWWKIPNGSAAIVNRAFKDTYLFNYSGWGGYATVDGYGILAEINPIAGLNINLGFNPGIDNSIFESSATGKDTEKVSTTKMAAWGIGVKYQILPELSAAISYADGGVTSTKTSDDTTDAHNPKLLKIGADYSANGFYGMLNGILRFEDYTKKGATKNAVALASITIDNYFEYSLDAWKFQLSVPFTLRMTELAGGRAADPSYFTYEAKVNYALDSVGLYALIGSKALDCGKIVFGTGADGVGDIKLEDTFAMQIKPGCTFSVGNLGFDIGVEFNIGAKGLTVKEDGTAAKANSFNINVPFKASISF